MLKSWLSWFFSIREDTDVSSTSNWNTSASIWLFYSPKESLTTVSLSWRKKYCFLWPYSSRLYCLVHALASVLWILLLCVSAGTRESLFTRHSRDWPPVENVQWDGFSDSNYTWLSTTREKSLTSCLRLQTWMTGNRWNKALSWVISRESYVQIRVI